MSASVFFAAKIFNLTFKDWAVLRAKRGFDIFRLPAPDYEIYFKDAELYKNFRPYKLGHYMQSGDTFRDDVHVAIKNSTFQNPWLEKVFDFTGSLFDFVRGLRFEGFEVTFHASSVIAQNGQVEFRYHESSRVFETYGAHVEFYVFKDTQWLDIEEHKLLWIPGWTLIPLSDEKTVLIPPDRIYQNGRIQKLDDRQIREGFAIMADDIVLTWHGYGEFEIRGENVLV